jgi:tetratricopeptide (TPR) repeat protein
MILLAGTESLLLDNQEEANTYFDQILESDSTQGDLKILALASYYKKDFKKAIPYFETLIKQSPADLDNYGYLAVAYQKTGRFQLAKEQLNHLNAARSDYQFGLIDYLLARFYTSQNEDKTVLNHLLKAVAEGYLYTPTSFQNDPDLYAYLKKPEFNRVMNFWK